MAEPRKSKEKSVRQTIIQAFQQAPWRVQVQQIGLIMLGLVVVALIAGVYLSITASTFEAGVRTQVLDNRKTKLAREIADTRTRLALLTSNTVMEKRAKELGFETANPWEFVYVPVPGYSGRKSRVVSAASDLVEYKPSLIRQAYTESLWEWMFRSMLTISEESRVVLQ